MTDHLGNVRTVVDITDAYDETVALTELVLEQNDYRPFGENIDDEDLIYDEDNRYRFAGKEEQTFMNGTYSDFGARFYSPDIQRWTTPDPLAEKYYDLSPYAFCNNNPINFVDKDGMDIYRYDDKPFCQQEEDTLLRRELKWQQKHRQRYQSVICKRFLPFRNLKRYSFR